MTDESNREIPVIERGPAPTPPPYPLGHGDQDSIVLRQGKLQLVRDGDVVFSGDGTVKFNWRPLPRTVFELDCESPLLREPPDRLSLILPDAGLIADAAVTSYGYGSSHIAGVVNRTRTAAPVEIEEIRFAVCNLGQFIGDRLYEHVPLESGGGQDCHWAGRLALSDSVWNLTLDSVRNHSEVEQRLRTRGGVAVTHTGSLRRVDDGVFAEGEASTAVHATAGFLALLRGDWAPPVLKVGLDRKSKVVWEDWSQPHASSWRGNHGPLSVFSGDRLPSAFAGYMHKWRDDLWGRPLRVAHHMYLEANGTVTLDTSLLLAQAALELITWVHFVEDEKSRNPEKYDKKWASTRLRDLLDWLQIDHAVPAALPELAQLKYEDGPHVFTELRNGIVHPTKRGNWAEQPMDVQIQLQKLALYYTELALLRLIGYEGEFVNRLTAQATGDRELVPWAR